MSSPRRRATVIGAGYVGLVTAVGLANLGHDVEVVETRPDRLRALRDGRVPIHEAGLQDAFDDAVAARRLRVADAPGPGAEVALVCVGTPIGEDGRSDLTQLRSALASLAPLLAEEIPLVVRSTLPPGATRLVVEWSGVPTARVLTNPEFLRQGTALADFLHPTRIVVGRFRDTPEATIELVRGLYDRLEAPVLVVDVAAAELIKNGANAFLALRLSYANEMAMLAEEYGADIDEVLTGISLDPRIGSSYLRPSFGFGGSCLPKELRALAAAGSARGLGMFVTTAASDTNAASQERFAERIVEAVDGVDEPTIAMLGLAFKADTDDIRDSPAVGVVRRLLARGLRVRAYDPAAALNARREVPELELAPSAEDALDGAAVAVIATEWPEFAALDWAAARDRMVRPVVLDGRRLLPPERLRELGFDYRTIGSPDGGTEVPVAR